MIQQANPNLDCRRLVSGRVRCWLGVSPLILLLALLVYVGFTYQYHQRQVDDAYITFRFAKNLAEGQGFAWNVGAEPVEGFTSILHVLLLALGIDLGVQPEAASLIISMAAVFGIIGLLLIILRWQLGVVQPIAAAILGLFLVDKTIVVHSTSGMETVLFVFLLGASYTTALWFLESPGWKSAILMALTVFLAVLGRPEGVLYGAVLYLVLFLYFGYRRWRIGNSNRESVLLGASAGLLSLLGATYAIWKWAYFGYLLPNSYYVKSERLSLDGLIDVLIFLGHLVMWFGPLIVLCLALSFFALRKRSIPLPSSAKSIAKVLLTTLPPLVALVYYSNIIHEVGFAYRFSFPTTFYLVLAIAVGLSLLLRSTQGSTWAIATLSTAGVGLILVQGALFQGFYRTEAKWPTVLPRHPIQEYHWRIARSLHETGLGPRATVITVAAGTVPYLSGFNHVDPVGLTDNFLAGRQDTTFEQREDYLWSRGADVYIGFHPPARVNAQSPDNDPLMDTVYISQFIHEAQVKRVTDHVYPGSPESLHRRMRELRDNWYWLGEVDSPNWGWLRLKSFIYIRKGSPHFERLTSALKPIISVEATQIHFDGAVGEVVPDDDASTVTSLVRQWTRQMVPRY